MNKRFAEAAPKSFFFYDLETSGLDAREDRIMQFAGQRTDLNLKPIGEPYNLLVALNDDTLPSPEALMVTGISPQTTRDEGYSEAEFAKILNDDIFTPGTITVGFNNVHFDDEFIRHLFWRNFYDPYEWTYSEGRSRWDLLDVVRLTRALRPEGIKWPVVDGVATNRLELITKENGIDHFKAHDALSDVEALIAVTALIKERQPKLYEYLLSMRDKSAVKALINLDDKKPFVYASGSYDSAFNKATVAFPLTSSRHGNIAVYDLRHDPTPLLGFSPEELKKRMFATRDERAKDDFIPVPVKELAYNKVPAVAPVGVLAADDGWKKLSLTPEIIEKHRNVLLQNPQFAENIRSIYEEEPNFAKSSDPEAQLYGGFLNDRDKLRVETVRNASERELADYHPEFADERLAPLLLHYKARSFPKTLSEAEALEWEKWRSARLESKFPSFLNSLSELSKKDLTEHQQFILQELQFWAESLGPSDF